MAGESEDVQPVIGGGGRRRVGEIASIVQSDPSLRESLNTFDAGSVILREGQRHPFIYFLLEGSVTLTKRQSFGESQPVDTLKAGDLLGLLSFFARETAYVGAVAATSVQALKFSWEAFDGLAVSHSRLHRLLHSLTIENLTSRYRRMVRLHLDLAALNRTLEQERNELRRTIAELQQTRNRLINQERLAALGQLIAGLAHEINNPAASLLRSVDFLRENLDTILRDSPAARAQGEAGRFWRYGLECGVPDSGARRQRLDALSREAPGLSPSLLRRISSLPEAALDEARRYFGSGSRGSDREETLEHLLAHFEAGYFVRAIRAASERISGLIVSLKNYSRPGRRAFEPTDVREGIRDTLLVLGARLRGFDVELDLEDMPRIVADAGELNQVWTNLIVNACDAMGSEGRLVVRSGREGPGTIFVSIADSGPGIAEELWERIFETNFTTKATGQNFGLGLGLAISRQIVRKHGGELSAERGPKGGALFKVVLPTDATAVDSPEVPRSG